VRLFIAFLLLVFHLRAMPGFDHLGAADALLKKGRIGESESELRLVDLDSPYVERARFYRVRSSLAFHKRNFTQAKADAVLSLEERLSSEALLLLFSSLEEMGDFESLCSKLKEHSKDVSRQESALFSFRCLIQNDELQAAWAMRAWMIENLKPSFNFFYLRALLAAKLELSDLFKQESLGAVLFAVDEFSVLRLLSMAEGDKFRRVKAIILEASNLKFSTSIKVKGALTKNYLAQASSFGVSLPLSDLAALSPKFSKKVSEYFKYTNRPISAEFWNSRIENYNEKLEDAIANKMMLRQYSSLSALAPQLKSYGVLENAELRFALAFSHLKSGKFVEADRQLSQIQDSKMLYRVAQLREFVEVCRAGLPQCYD